jgi:phosphatidylglycerophosphate synthase
MAGFMYAAPRNSAYALILLLLRALMDTLDGCLARHLKCDSDRGKFTDVLADSAGFTFFIVGITAAGLLHASIAVLFVYAVLLLRVLATLRRNYGQPTDWLIRPMAGAFPNFFPDAFYVLYILHALWKIDFFTPLGILALICIFPKILMEYHAVRNLTPKKGDNLK